MAGALLSVPGLLGAQAASAPVFDSGPGFTYPPIARAAHVSGTVEISFSIDSDGTTKNIFAVSGPVMLISSATETVKGWKFKTPLPLDAATDFKATYHFGVDEDPEDFSDSLDRPLWEPSGGDMVILPSASFAIHGTVRSVSGDQVIEISATKPKVVDQCPNEKMRTPPAKSAADDFVQLETDYCDAFTCGRYRVRVDREGKAVLTPLRDMRKYAEIVRVVQQDDVDRLFAQVTDEHVWSLCSDTRALQPDDEPQGTQLTLRVAGARKVLDAYEDEDHLLKLVWAIQKAAEVPAWLRQDFAAEPFADMQYDVQIPKPGLTALIRATYRYSTRSGQVTLDPLKALLEKWPDLEATDASGWTALMYASYANPEAIPLLLKAGANARRASLHGDTPLMMAAYGYKGLDEDLLQAGADINAHNADGVTVLMLLAQRQNADEIKDALKAGADVNAKDNAGHTALDYLVAAACDKPYVANPEPRGMVIIIKPKGCPAKTEGFVATEAVLKAAMRRSGSGRDVGR